MAPGYRTAAVDGEFSWLSTKKLSMVSSWWLLVARLSRSWSTTVMKLIDLHCTTGTYLSCPLPPHVLVMIPAQVTTFSPDRGNWICPIVEHLRCRICNNQGNDPVNIVRELLAVGYTQPESPGGSMVTWSGPPLLCQDDSSPEGQHNFIVPFFGSLAAIHSTHFRALSTPLENY